MATVREARSQHDDDDNDTISEYQTWQSVMDWLLRKAQPQLAIVLPSLSHLNIFMDILREKLANGVDVSFLWGSLACLLQLVSRSPRMSEQIPRMIKSVALKTETFNMCCLNISEGNNTFRLLSEVAFDLHLQIIDFLTVSIRHIRNTEQGLNGPQIEQRFQQRFERMNKEFAETLARLQVGQLSPSQSPKPNTQTNPHLNMTPPTFTNHLFDRLDIFEQLDDLLASKQSVVLHGLGGVGKTSIASCYAKKKFADNTYDVILWVCGGKDASLQQSFTNIAVRLKLAGAQPQAHEENQVLVHDWLQSTECRWLLMYDNVETAGMLNPYWVRPSPSGRIIITTRNRSLAFDPAEIGLEVASWDSSTGADFLLFLLKKSIGTDVHSERRSARTLSERLSGHALALQQMAGLIHDGQYSIRDFTDMYLRNPDSAHAMDELAALWDYSFRSLDTNSFNLLGVISFLMPDNIPAEILEPQRDQKLPEGLEFLKDIFNGFATALRRLTTRALIKRDKDSRAVTVHRLVQTQFRHFLGPDRRQKFFNNTLALLSHLIPRNEIEKGQLYDTWAKYDKYLQHVLNLRDVFDEERKSSSEFTAPQTFCEILNVYQRYLLEKCSFEECERTCAINRIAVSTLAPEEDKLDLEGTIISHQAQVLEYFGNFHEASRICQQEIDLRLEQSPQKQILLCYSTSNLGIIYSGANDFKKAMDCFQQARGWWASHFKGKDANRKYDASLLVFEARSLIGLGQFDLAEEMLNKSITQINEGAPLEYATLAQTQFFLGNLDRCRHRPETAEEHFMEAQNAWLMVDNSTRIHPFNAGILYKTGAACLDQGKVDAAIKHLRDSLEVTEFHKRLMPAEHGRNLFKLSEALMQSSDDMMGKAIDLRDEAEQYLKKKDPNASISGVESAYDDYISVCWR